MTGKLTILMLGLGIISGGQPRRTEPVLSVCDLAKNYGAYSNKVIAIRGVYYYGLREDCQQKCGTRPWPSFLDLAGDVDWDELANTEQTVEREAKGGKRFEIWVTAHGQLKTKARPSSSDPCDNSRSPGYGHLGAFPAQLVVSSFSDIKVVENPDSPYDYANMYHGPM